MKHVFKAGAILCCALWATAGSNSLSAEPATPAKLDNDCVLRLAEQGDGQMTLDAVRAACSLPVSEVGPEAGFEPGTELAQSAIETEAEVRPVEQRLEAEREEALRPFSLMAHKPNYMLVGAYNSKGWSDYSSEQFPGVSTSFKEVEAQFQASIKVPLWIGMFNDRADLYAAYTNRSFWQVYDHIDSEPFRETNHEPEAWLQFRNDWKVFGFTNSVNSVGLVHQSNGRGGDLSRAWDRMYGNFVFEKNYWAVGIKPWVWLIADKKDSDNPDIEDYMGHGEFRLAYANNGHTISAMFRNQLESGFDRGAVELSWSIPVFQYPYLRAYIQYFNGYGESLIDYNQKVNRIGIGISVTDWLQ
jgi:phospholipase A1